MVFKEEESSKVVSERFQPQALTPMRIPTADDQIIKPPSDTNAQRHLAVLHDFLQSVIAENIPELRKRFSAVCRAMKSRLVRNELCVCLTNWKSNVEIETESKYLLSINQFEYIVRLTESALTNSTGSSDEYQVATAMVPISSQLYRKLGSKKQYLYTQIQDHAVWSNYDFWLDHFFVDNQIRLANHYRPELAKQQSDRYSNVTILRVAAEQLADWKNKTENQRKDIGEEEEGIVFSQVIELIYQVIPLLVPFNPAKIGALHRHMRANQQAHDGGSSIFTNSAMDEDTDEDEGFAESGGNLQIVHKFIEKIQDKLCIECKISNTHSTQLQMLAQSTINQFSDEYQEIQRAFKTLPTIRKPVDHAPKMLQNEIVKRQIAAFLLNDNREFGIYQFEDTKVSAILTAKESLLPAEGTLFLTNYRLIFHGTSLEHERNIILRAVLLFFFRKWK